MRPSAPFLDNRSMGQQYGGAEVMAVSIRNFGALDGLFRLWVSQSRCRLAQGACCAERLPHRLFARDLLGVRYQLGTRLRLRA